MAEIYNFNGEREKRTIKEVGVEEVIQEALDNDIDTISVISSGNYLDALLGEIKKRGVEDRLRIVNLVNKPLRNSKLELLIENNRILRNAEERERYVNERIIDAGKVRDYTDFIPTALQEKAEEMIALNPDYISSGVGTGKLFVALYRAIKKRGLNTKLIGVVPKGENGIFNDNNLTEDEQGNLHYKRFNPKTLADKLATPYTSYKEEILEAIKEGHLVIEATNKDFKNANREAIKRGYNAEYSGSAGFVLCDERIREKYEISDDSNILMVNTGKGSEGQKVIEFHWYQRILKTVAVAAASLLLALGLKQGIDKYQYTKLEHSALAQTATIASDIIGDKINVHKMSSLELDQYISNAKNKIGGPTHYW